MANIFDSILGMLGIGGSSAPKTQSTASSTLKLSPTGSIILPSGSNIGISPTKTSPKAAATTAAYIPPAKSTSTPKASIPNAVTPASLASYAAAQTPSPAATYVSGGGPSSPSPAAPSYTPPQPAYVTPSAPSKSGGGNPLLSLGNLSPGSTGNDVMTLQTALINAGYSIPAGATGYYGDQTKAAVAQMQKDLGVDAGANAGYFGPLTKSAITSAISSVGGGNPLSSPAATLAAAGTPDASQPASSQPGGPQLTLEQFLQKTLEQANAPFDYSAAASAAKTAYEQALGTPEAQANAANVKAMYEEQATKALDEAKGNLAVRGLLGSGVGDKEIADLASQLGTGEAAAVTQAELPFQQAELKTISDWISGAAGAQQTTQQKLLSLLPSFLGLTGTTDEKNYQYLVNNGVIDPNQVSFLDYQNAVKSGSLGDLTQLLPGAGGNTPTPTQPVQAQYATSTDNNPLNVTLGAATQKYVDSGVATVKTANGLQFLSFSDPNVGTQAAQDLLFGPTYSNMTVDQAMKTWSNGGYDGKIAQNVGIDPQAKVGDLPADQRSKLVQAMAQAEGGRLPAQAAQATSAPIIGNKDSGIDPSTGVYSGPSVAKGNSPQEISYYLSTGPSVTLNKVKYSQPQLYNSAILSLIGAPDASVGGMGAAAGRATIGAKKAAIQAAFGIDNSDVAAAAIDYKALTGAQVKLVSQNAFIKTYTNTAMDNLNLALSQSPEVTRTDSPFINSVFQNYFQNGVWSTPQLSKFETYIYTAAREYAKVTSGGAMSAQGLTDSAQKEVSKLINAAQSPDTFKQVVDAMINDMNNVNKEFDKTIGSMPSSVQDIFNKLSGGQSVQPLSSAGGASGIQDDLNAWKQYWNNGQFNQNSQGVKSREDLIKGLQSAHADIPADQIATAVYQAFPDVAGGNQGSNIASNPLINMILGIGL